MGTVYVRAKPWLELAINCPDIAAEELGGSGLVGGWIMGGVWVWQCLRLVLGIAFALWLPISYAWPGTWMKSAAGCSCRRMCQLSDGCVDGWNA